jgi:hypothetical protein
MAMQVGSLERAHFFLYSTLKSFFFFRFIGGTGCERFNDSNTTSKAIGSTFDLISTAQSKATPNGRQCQPTILKLVHWKEHIMYPVFPESCSFFFVLLWIKTRF